MTSKNNTNSSCINLEKCNKYLANMSSDYLYHLDLNAMDVNVQKKFADVKFVCMGGSNMRMKNFAQYIYEKLQHKYPIEDYTSKRFAFFKIGPVISVSHGMGMSSISILIHEMIKLMYHAKCNNPIFIRIGTCGGVGVDPGTVIITKDALNGLGNNVHEFLILGKRVERCAKFDVNLANEIKSCIDPSQDNYEIRIGNTVATDDFYEGQGRTDGAICFHTEEEKMNYLTGLHKRKGVLNFEMEATVLAAITGVAGIKTADVCVALVNRFLGDQVTVTKDQMHEYEERLNTIVGRFIVKNL